MSDKILEKYLEEKGEEFEQILLNKDWAQIQEFYKEMEEEGYGQYVPELSEVMSDEDVAEYKKWDLLTNGSIETQMDDNS